MNKDQLDQLDHLEKEDNVVIKDFEENLETKDHVVQLGRQVKQVYQVSPVQMVDQEKLDFLALLEHQG